MKLYELTGTMVKIIHDLEAAESDGNADLSEALQNALTEWGDDTKDKLLSVAKYREQLLAESAAISAVALKQANRAKALKARADWLEGYIIRSMKAAQIPSIDTPEMRLRIKTGSGSVEIDDADKVPATFWRWIPASKEVSKTDLRTHLIALAQSGNPAAVPGARLVFNEKLEIK